MQSSLKPKPGLTALQQGRHMAAAHSFIDIPSTVSLEPNRQTVMHFVTCIIVVGCTAGAYGCLTYQ